MLMYFFEFSPAKIADVMAALTLVNAKDIDLNEVKSSITVTFHANLNDTDKALLAFYGSLTR